jgi:PadR family transcriptional regulator PadR
MGAYHNQNRPVGDPKVFQRTLVKALLPHTILRTIAEKPTHGYALIQKMRKEEDVYLAPSTMYPLLAELEGEGFITSAWQIDGNSGKPKKVYDITTKGKLLLKETSATLAYINQQETIIV